MVPKTSSTVGATPPTGNGAIFRLSSQFMAQDEGLGGFSCSVSCAWDFYESVETGGANSWDSAGEQDRGGIKSQTATHKLPQQIFTTNPIPQPSDSQFSSRSCPQGHPGRGFLDWDHPRSHLEQGHDVFYRNRQHTWKINIKSLILCVWV